MPTGFLLTPPRAVWPSGVLGAEIFFHGVPLRKPQNQFLLLGELKKKKTLLLPQLAQIHKSADPTQKKTEEFPRARTARGG